VNNKEPDMPKTTSLDQFVARENQFARIFGNRTLSIRNAQDRRTIAELIDSRLSPENLHCDGEISAAEARRKYQFLAQAARQLMAVDSTVKICEL
jgi:hypothetical protein